MSEPSSEAMKPFVSSLGKGREAFHAEVTEFCLRIGERTPEDFLRHFPCRSIMKSLEARPMERARIVSQSTGVHEKVATKMSPEASGEALQIAIDERITTPADIVRLFSPDDKQRYLSRHALWAFDVEGQPWKALATNKGAHDRAKSYIAYILDRALENLLISHEEVVSAITVSKLAQCLTKEKLGEIIEASLKTSEKFTEEDLIAAVPPSNLVEHVALDYLWERVVTPLIAEAHDYVNKPVVVVAPQAAGANGFGSMNSLAPEAGWDEEAKRRSMRPDEGQADADNDADAAPNSGSIVSEDEIVTEDEILESELTEEAAPSANTTSRKGGQGKKAQV
jgi:hypothetical protein